MSAHWKVKYVNIVIFPVRIEYSMHLNNINYQHINENNEFFGGLVSLHSPENRGTPFHPLVYHG